MCYHFVLTHGCGEGEDHQAETAAWFKCKKNKKAYKESKPEECPNGVQAAHLRKSGSADCPNCNPSRRTVPQEAPSAPPRAPEIFTCSNCSYSHERYTEIERHAWHVHKEDVRPPFVRQQIAPGFPDRGPVMATQQHADQRAHDQRAYDQRAHRQERERQGLLDFDNQRTPPTFPGAGTQEHADLRQQERERYGLLALGQAAFTRAAPIPRGYQPPPHDSFAASPYAQQGQDGRPAPAQGALRQQADPQAYENFSLPTRSQTYSALAVAAPSSSTRANPTNQPSGERRTASRSPSAPPGHDLQRRSTSRGRQVTPEHRVPMNTMLRSMLNISQSPPPNPPSALARTQTMPLATTPAVSRPGIFDSLNARRSRSSSTSSSHQPQTPPKKQATGKAPKGKAPVRDEGKKK